ncbi:hypothetical protein ADJ73_03720 [Arsenicicoccus sp. oral taxon 190]|nr:hypothetical protein ADJ73_03720 [Arsenicicoccus sp. oral taxon 190]
MWSAVAAATLIGSLAAGPALAAHPQAAAPAAARSAQLVRADDAKAQALLARLRATITPERLARSRELAQRHGLTREAINPGDYQCGPTVFRDWIRQSTADFTSVDWMILDNYGVLDYAAYDAMLFGSSSDPAYRLGAHAGVLDKTFRKLRGFWDIRSDDIDLMAMHGSMVLDPVRVSRVLQVAFGVPKAQADSLAPALVDYLSDPKFQGGNHPIFTLNAFAFTAFGREVVPGIIPGDRIIMGDGILRAYDELGFGDVAPQAILAHEFGHHVQFEIGMITPDTIDAPETTRRTELHADASAAYFLSHPRGLSMQWKRVKQFLSVFYTIGDCSFTSPGHHGTPNQRMRAAEWAYQLQESTRPKSLIYSTREFQRRFDAQLPIIVAPDKVTAAA